MEWYPSFGKRTGSGRVTVRYTHVDDGVDKQGSDTVSSSIHASSSHG
jgi:hypothetical protein